MRRTREHPPTALELTTDLERMQRVQTNVDRLRLEYIEEKRIQLEQHRADLAAGAEPGPAPAALNQGPGFKAEDQVMDSVRELGSATTEGLTVGEVEKREMELRRRQFGTHSSRWLPPRQLAGSFGRIGPCFFSVVSDPLTRKFLSFFLCSCRAGEAVVGERKPERRLYAPGVDTDISTKAAVDRLSLLSCCFTSCNKLTKIKKHLLWAASDVLAGPVPGAGEKSRVANTGTSELAIIIAQRSVLVNLPCWYEHDHCSRIRLGVRRLRGEDEYGSGAGRVQKCDREGGNGVVVEGGRRFELVGGRPGRSRVGSGLLAGVGAGLG